MSAAVPVIFNPLKPMGQVAYADGQGGFAYDSTLNFVPPASPSRLNAQDMLGLGHISVGDQARIDSPSPIPFLSADVFSAIIMLADAADGDTGSPPTTVAVGIANHIDYNLLQNAPYPYYAYDGRIISRAGNTFTQGTVAVSNSQFLNLATGDFTYAVGHQINMAQNGPAASDVANMTAIDILHGAGNGGTVAGAFGINIHPYVNAAPSVTTNFTALTVGGAATIATTAIGLSMGDYRPAATGAATLSRACVSSGGTWEFYPGDGSTAIFKLHRDVTGLPNTTNMIEMTNNAGTVVSGFHYDWAWWPVNRTDAQAVNESCYFSTTQSVLAYKDASGAVHSLYGMKIADPVLSGTAGSILFVGTGPVLSQDNTDLFWDDTNKRMRVNGDVLVGVSTAVTPPVGLTVRRVVSGATLGYSNVNIGGNPIIVWESVGNPLWAIDVSGSSMRWTQAFSTIPMDLDTSGNLHILGNITSDGSGNTNFNKTGGNFGIGLGSSTPDALCVGKVTSAAALGFSNVRVAGNPIVVWESVGNPLWAIDVSGTTMRWSQPGVAVYTTLDTSGNLTTVGTVTALDGSFQGTDGSGGIVNKLTLTHDSSGSPGAGFGVSAQYKLASATVQDRLAAEVDVLWATATDASRKAQVIHYVSDTAAREFLRGEASGSAAMIGFLGANASVRQASGADLTNNVTVGGTTDTIADFSDLTTYANSAAAIRNDIYQLARKVKQINDALRLYGLLT